MFKKYYREYISSKYTLDDVRNQRTILNHISSSVEEKEKSFNNIILYWREEIQLFSKYYLVNKNKTDCSNIQKNIQKKINLLAKTGSLNKYQFKIEKESIDKKTNKHKYNNFTIIITEFRYMTLNDILDETLIHKLKLSFAHKLQIYKALESFIKANRKRLRQTSVGENGKTQEFHNELIIQIKEVVAKEIRKIFDTVLGRRVEEIISNSPRILSRANTTELGTIIDLPSILNDDDKIAKEVAEIYAELELPEDCLWLRIYSEK